MVKAGLLLSSIFLPLLGDSSPTPKWVRVDAASSWVQSQTQWQTYTSLDGGFRVLFPSSPQTMTQSIPLESWNLELYVLMAEDATGEYMVVYSDYPDGFIERLSNREALLEGVQQGFIQGMDATMLSDRDLSLGQYPGREIRYSTQEGVTGIARFYLVGKRLYQLVVRDGEGERESLTRRDRQFFDSFDLSDR
ncbi:MAG: hypothetical protein WBB29_02860 [Geitlerinemataceae cyanobacterium]